ncbi:NlpC/P60 family protein [Actinopolyspora halophila]|uniref:C40 family peptidase n=1 Tax=Actinopolyspora halophila TaxID=1850 RepID=UPI000370C6AB|nr:bifunctional lytic transglycosylase/C40 family peptidase [Actinopolyspora halophila]
MNNAGMAVAAVVGMMVSLILGLVILIGGQGGLGGSGPAGLDTKQVPEPYRQWVRQAGQLCSPVSAPVIAAQIEAESGWEPQATSGAGAQGIAQFMPGTWDQWGRDTNNNGRTSPHEPADAILAQGRYMCHLVTVVRGYRRTGQAQGEVLDLALAAYNAGPGAVRAAGGIPHNGETELYVPKIRRLVSTYTAPTGGARGSELGRAVVAEAEAELGTPYVWGGGNHHGPTDGGYDCSGLVMYALYQASGGRIALDKHLADWQVTQGQAIVPATTGSDVDTSQLDTGDIIGFANPGSTDYHHIGIYAGGGQMIHAPTSGQTVTLSDLSGSYWQGQTWIVRRFR